MSVLVPITDLVCPLFHVITSGVSVDVVAVSPPPVSLWSEHFANVAVEPDVELLNTLQDVPVGGAAAAREVTRAPVSPDASAATTPTAAR